MLNPTIAWITLRATLGSRRKYLFAIPGLILIVFTLALKAAHLQSGDWQSHVLSVFGFTVLLPLSALLIGTNVLGAEVDDGSIVHLLATPVRRASVIMTKYAVATGLTVVFAAVPELIAAFISGGGSTPPTPTTAPATISDGKFALAMFVGALAAAVIYNALFVMVSVATTRAIAVGLLYVLIWESVLSNIISGARLLSIGHYGLGISNAFLHDEALKAGLTVATSIAMGAIVTVVTLALAIRLLSSFTLKGDPA